LNTTEEANSNPLPTNYTNTINPQQIIARITDKTTKCYSLGTLTLKTKVINEAPILLEGCDVLGRENGFAIFNLNNANLALSPTQTIKYYSSLNDALLEEKNIKNFDRYTNKTPYSESVFARIEENNACYGIAEIQLKVNKLPNIITEGKDFLCTNITGDSVWLNANLSAGNTTDYSYKWHRNGQLLPQTTFEIQANQTGTYSVEVTNSKSCSKTRTIAVEQSATATMIDAIISEDNAELNSVTVLATGTGKYSYSLDKPDGPFQTATLFEKVSVGIHELYVYDENGCGITSKTIATIGIPKFFTPNNDGYNDAWVIKEVNAIFNIATTVFIFDRFGKLLKQMPIGDTSGWNGSYDDKPLPADDYWYNINLSDGRIVKGHFALKR
jgi:gliding motility-associated-like protein